MQDVTHTLLEIVGKELDTPLRIYVHTRECGDIAITVSLLLGVAPTDIAAIYTVTFAFPPVLLGEIQGIYWICTHSKIVFRVQFTLSCKIEDYRADYY